MKTLKNKLDNELTLILNADDLTFIENETKQMLDPKISNSSEAYEKQFRKNVKKYILGEFSSQKSKNFLSQYINNVFQKKLSDIESMKLISSLFKTATIFPEIDYILNLITNNEQVSTCLENIYKNNQESITNGNLNLILDDDIFIMFMEVFLDFKGITLLEKDEEEIDLTETDTEVLDATKAFLIKTRKFPILSYEETANLFIEYKNGSKSAREKLINHNLRLIINIANRYTTDKNELLDLIQDGIPGIIKAINKFDYTKGYRFSTFATWWIRQSITRAIEDTTGVIRIPSHMHHDRNRFYKIYQELGNQLGRDPTLEELANNSNYSISKIKKILSLPDNIRSLNSPIKDEEENEFGNLIPDENYNTEEAGEYSVLFNEIQNWLKSTLKPHEIEVLTYRMGLNGKGIKTLESIAKTKNVTRQRIEQIEKTALRKLRKSSKAKYFAEYMDYPEEAKEALALFKEGKAIINPCRRYGDNIKRDVKKPKKQNDIQQKTNTKEKGGKNMIENQKEEQAKTSKNRPSNKSRKNLYMYFSYSTEIQIDEVIQSLEEHEKALLKQIYGEDLKNPTKFELNDKIRNSYNGLIQKIQRRLEKKFKKRIIKRKPTAEPKVDIIKESNEFPSEEQTTNNISELYDNLYFINLIRELPIKESAVMFLRRNYSTIQIAEALNMDVEEVIEINKNGINLLKTRLNTAFDSELQTIKSEIVYRKIGK